MIRTAGLGPAEPFVVAMARRVCGGLSQREGRRGGAANFEQPTTLGRNVCAAGAERCDAARSSTGQAATTARTFRREADPALGIQGWGTSEADTSGSGLQRPGWRDRMDALQESLTRGLIFVSCSAAERFG
jgi:hypothetical protein